MSDLLFFPMSMPDEMLHSRITRYHYLSGNRTEAETFRDLFGSSPFGVGMLPKQINHLAARLPGDMASNLYELISSNTTFPAYRPFLGLSEGMDQEAGGYRVHEVARVPRREVTVHRKARICLSCVQQDLLEVGYSYWHRSHHLPGVIACWRHGETLIHACPKCYLPFYRKNKLLPNLTEECLCGWSPLSAAVGGSCSDIEMKFAIFAHKILQRNMPPVCSKVLGSSLTRQCKKLGFNHGGLVSTAKLIASIRDKYGDEVLSKMDRAFEQGKLDAWIRFRVYKGQIDMPLARHLIIAFHLFGSAEKFESSLNSEAILAGAAKPASPSKSKDKVGKGSRKDEYRQKIETLLAFKSDVGMEYLWTNAYKATRWLKENDGKWLSAKLSATKRETISAEESCDPRDQLYAETIQVAVEKMYRITKDQKRVNLGNLLKTLPTRVSLTPAVRQQKFPLVSDVIERSLESVWHFRLRRLIWGMVEAIKLNLPLNTNSMSLVSAGPIRLIFVISSLFEWDLEDFAKNGIDPEALLKSTGVSHKWEGPPGYQGPLGGHAYQRKTPIVELLGRAGVDEAS
ncbi:TniQ family protein [Pseudomonas sichuanensis]|uniref:TniQ family protein n=1 Tax=Pseudomonas sichuanensis TaxID=2213015 RepID=UPI00215FD4D6|nr:TniQ family protein [Pseudomonas sichuanensis]UVK83112.1 TniQ family protein [Pseudomonas sichuanensis]